MKKLILAAALTATAAPAHAACIAIAPGLPGWERLDFDDVPSNTWAEQNGALVVTADSSSSVLYTGTPATDNTVLTWRWRVDQPVPATDLTRKGGDDRSLAVTVGFAYDPATASMSERMKRMVVEAVAGADAPGRVIEFVWGGNEAKGSLSQSPYSGNAGRIATLRTTADPSAQWVEERVDVAALYQQIWGETPPPVTRIGLIADSDDTKIVSKSQIADICFNAG